MEVQPCDIPADILTFYIQVNNFPEGINDAFIKLGELTGGFEGREIFGVSAMIDGKMIYRACAKERHPGEGSKYQLPYYTIPKGKYISTTLKNWRQHLNEINGIFAKLMQHPNAKKQSIVLEYYKNEDEAILMLERID